MNMFFMKYQNNKYSYLKMGTLVLRNMSAAALVAISFMRDMMNSSDNNHYYHSWMWVQSVADEYRKMMKKGQEINKIASYTPYLMTLGRAIKSPYSATVNPNLFTFINVIGASLGVIRSINARQLDHVN